MRKLIYNQYGSVDGLTLADAPEPTLAADHVLVDVHAVGINPLDWKLFEGQLKFVTGWKFPRGVGIEFAGEVRAVGTDVRSTKPGDAVFGMLDAFTGGALAERLAVPAGAVHPRPPRLTHAQAAAMPIGALSAMQILHDLAHVEPGARVLVNGAAGGVGVFASQIARRLGARVTAAVSARGVPLAEGWGCEEVVDYSRTPVTGLGERFDVVIDLSGKLPFAAAAPLMVAKSTYVSCNPNPADILLGAVHNLHSGRQRRVLTMKDRPEQLQQVCKYVEEGLEVVVGRTFPFAAFREAYTELMSKGTVGKAVFLLDPSTP